MLCFFCECFILVNGCYKSVVEEVIDMYVYKRNFIVLLIVNLMLLCLLFRYYKNL